MFPLFFLHILSQASKIRQNCELFANICIFIVYTHKSSSNKVDVDVLDYFLVTSQNEISAYAKPSEFNKNY